MRKYGYLAVEGPHDVEFCFRLLAPFNLERVKQLKKLDDALKSLVPGSFPHKGELETRVPIPIFLQNDSHAIAIQSAMGDSQLVGGVRAALESTNAPDYDGIGIIIDADSDTTVMSRYHKLKVELTKHSNESQSPKFSELARRNLSETPGTIREDNPAFGAFVLPDNSSSGNLETLLLACAERSYPNLLAKSREHIASVKLNFAHETDGVDLTKPSVANKAIVGAIANVLKPGFAVQNSIRENKWLSDEHMNLPQIKQVRDFLARLFDLS